ncbi:MAG: FidL-like protein [Ewingella sp.]
MRLSRGNVAYISVAIILAIILSSIILTRKSEPLEINCKAFVKVNIDLGHIQVAFSIIKYLELYGNGQGIILFEGDVISGDSKSYLERTVYLSHGVKIDDNNYNFIIDKIVRSPLDTTLDKDFYQMWLENTGDNKLFPVRVKKIRENSYLISSPYSPQFICIE